MSANGNIFNRFSKFVFSKDMIRYICSTHFWGPVSNFGIPIAAILDTQKSPDVISGPMTGSLIVYSVVFMRYALAVTPKNYLLFGCHMTNEAAQLVQGFRFVKYNYFDTKKKAIPSSSTDVKT